MLSWDAMNGLLLTWWLAGAGLREAIFSFNLLTKVAGSMSILDSVKNSPGNR